MRKVGTPALLLLTSVGLRLLLIFRYRFDSDEPQHMHVAWGWAHGLMQYRDVFDNHMPLFHMLSAPMFMFAGDDVRLLFAARLAMLPLFAASLFLVWRIARRLYDEKTAWWSTAFVALCPPFFLGSLEYRTDDLWVVFWLATIFVLIGESERTPKALAAGLLLGGAFGVSMKSVLFAIALIVAVAITFLMTRQSPARVSLSQVLMATAGAMVVPGGIALGFVVAGEWRSFFYGVIDHNRIPFEHAWRVLWFIPLYLVIRTGAIAIARSEVELSLKRRRLFVFLATFVYLLLVMAFWPMTSMETYLPFYPPAVVLITPFLLRQRFAVPAFAAAASIAAVVILAEPWRNAARQEVELVTEIIGITEPNEPVMDLKGESIFRPRPYHLVLEAITNMKMRRGVLRDQITDALLRTATHVIVGDNFPARTRRFIEQNYLPWGLVRVAGARLPALPGDGTPIAVRIAIPGTYVVVGERGVVHAFIDGTSARHGVNLQAGTHSVMTFDRVNQPLLIWSRALRLSPQ